MNSHTELDLLRLLRGDLPEEEARELRDRLAREPELAEAWRRLAASWDGLEPPAAAPVPPGFAGRVMARVREEAPAAAEIGLSWAQAPAWVRAAAAAALLAGAVLGAGLAWPAAPPPAAVVAAAPNSSAGAVAPVRPAPVPAVPAGPEIAATPAPPATPGPAPPAPPAAGEIRGEPDEAGEIAGLDVAGDADEAEAADEDGFGEPGAASLAEGYWAAFGEDLGETLP